MSFINKKTNSQLPKSLDTSRTYLSPLPSLDIELLSIEFLTWCTIVSYRSKKFNQKLKGVIRYGYINKKNQIYYGIMSQINNHIITELVPYDDILQIVKPSKVPNMPYIGKTTTYGDGKKAFIYKFVENSEFQGVDISISSRIIM